MNKRERFIDSQEGTSLIDWTDLEAISSDMFFYWRAKYIVLYY